MACSKLDVIDPESTALVTYESSIKSGTHGDVYQKQLAQLLLLRLTREERDFNLAYELTSADKFDDVVLYDKEAKQWIFLQSKHADGKDSKIDLNGLLPEANREKGDFSLYKYFTSYMLIRDRFKGKHKFLLFTNKKLDEKLKTARNHLLIDDQEVHEYLRFTFEGATHKVLTPTESTIQSIMEYANKDLYALKDAIKELFTKGIITKELQKYKAYLRNILNESENNQICFKNFFNDSLIFIAKLYKMLQPELQDLKPIDKPKALDIKEVEFVHSSCPPDEGQDFEQLIDAIKNVFRTGIVTDILKKYENLIALILTTANGQLAFKHTFNRDVVFKAELYRLLKNELCAMNKEVTTKQKLFDGKDSRNKHHSSLFYVDASDVRDFFEHLTLSVHQPDKLEPFIVEELHLWMKQWLRPDVLGKLTEVDDKNAVKDLDDYFDAALQCEQGNCKPYLRQDFATQYLNRLRSKIEEMYPILHVTNQLYINRVITFEKEEKEVHQSETLNAPQLDEKILSKMNRGSRRFDSHINNTSIPLIQMTNKKPHAYRMLVSSFVEKMKNVVHDKISLNRAYEEMSDIQFAANLKHMFSHNQCLVVIADPGLGKTELFHYVALEHQKLESGAVFLFYLNKIQDSKDVLGNDSSLDILKSALSQKNVELIQSVLDKKTVDHITILFDGYDEIHEKNRNKIDDLLELLMKSKHIQLVISARSHKKSSLQRFFQKHNMNVRYFSLQPFSSNNITDYLAHSWKEKEACDVDPKFNTYSKFLIEKLYSLCRVPLMTKMVSEIYKSSYDQFKVSPMIDEGSEISYLDKEFLEVEHIYEIFIEKCLEVKTEDACNGIGKVDSNKQILDGFYVDHQLLAIKFLDVDELKFVLKIPKNKRKLDSIQTCHQQQYEKSILVQFIDDEVSFTHHSYAEYFVAKFLWDNFEYVKNIIKNVLSSFPGIRKFFIRIIEKEDISYVSEIDQEASLFSEEFILWACECNAIELLKIVLSKEIQHRPKEKEMFQSAIENGSDKICSYLIDDCQVHPDVELNGGLVPLHVAIECDQRHIVQLLIENGADVNIRNANSHTPLHFASHKGHKDVVEILIMEKANIEALDQDNWTPLHLACMDDRKEVVEILIREKANIEALTESKFTPLHLACLKGQKEVVKILIREKANIKALAIDKCTPLHFASHNGHKDVVEILIRENVNIEALDQVNWTPLHVACASGHKEVVEILIRENANIEALTKSKHTPLQWACRNGHKEVVEILIRENANIEALTESKFTPLHLACQEGHKEVVEILIRENANIEALTESKFTPLHLACQEGHKEVVEILIRENANIEALTESKFTPLHLACQEGHKEVVEILIREKANIEALTKSKHTPLQLACRKGHKEVVEILIRENANIEALTESKLTPLHLACQEGHKEVVEILIREKANIEALTKSKYTPLQLACRKGHKEVVEILIRENANIEALTESKFTPLHLACRKGHKEIVEILIRENANIEALNHNNWTPLHVACQSGHKEVVEILIRENANIEALAIAKCTPLHFACLKGHKEVVEILIRENANIEALNHNNWTPLHIACQSGHKEVVEILIRENANIEALIKSKSTLLHWACLFGHKEVAEILIRGKANVEALDQNNLTPLHWACQEGHKEVVEILIRGKANVEALDQNNLTPLHWACQEGHKEVVEILIREKANIEASATDKSTPLHFACLKGHKEVVEILIREKANVEALDQYNLTPLHWACQEGQKEVVEILIRGKANVEALDQNNLTPLHWACQEGHKEVVEILIREKANIEALDIDKSTPLYVACQNGHKEVVEMLIRENANVEALDQDNWTPLHWACQEGHKEVVEILIREKANIEALDIDKSTPLHVACQNGHKEVLEILIGENANINALAHENWTALHLACLHGHKEIVEILLRENANVHITIRENCTPLHFASHYGHEQVVEILLKKKANIDALDEENWTPLHFACRSGHEEIVKILLREKANIDTLNDENCSPLDLACQYGHKEVEKLMRNAICAVTMGSTIC
ncbi:uncharacterized protein LOC115256613 isoform X1 [Aedes albopictus]|uniref:NACHT domain-containing protein n=1 Tax=Aedes albopictus TaxID=7160 RepID=A0ABM1Y051_AEDAL|nr:uncharacterized protein LOC109424560 isoform X1 [Aedes albopictus]XP_029710537.1 uncharacterized protein LOC109424560 isoform X1 [Aedes albopictus]XP_029710538.1 uncharacterized protein LOC109424560 isoform X1 [Aedes albopictus]